MSVRRLRSADRPAWQAMWDDYLSFYRAEVSSEVTERTFTRLCDPGEDDVVGLVALDTADQPVGLAHLILHPTTWAQTPYCYLEDLFVRPAARGSGVANQLFAAVDELARAHDCQRIYWHTQQFNGAARSLYDTVGQLTSFVLYEREPPPS